MMPVRPTACANRLIGLVAVLDLDAGQIAFSLPVRKALMEE